MATGQVVLRAHDLGFAYRRGADELFDGLAHDFAPGEVTALTGPSGRGKSTLLYLLGLLLTPTRGQVEVLGTPASRVADAARARLRADSIGFVFQDAQLDPARKVIDSVIEPALYSGQSRSQARPRALGLLDQFGLADRADHRPGQVSGGQAQRVAICRALVNEPVIVLADEPTGNLDRDSAALVLQALRHAATERGCTVVIATHDPFVVDQADHEVKL